MQELMKSSFFWFFRGDGSGIPIITQKKPGLSPALSKPLLYLYFSGFVFVFPFKR